jgi:hypothetical protein
MSFFDVIKRLLPRSNAWNLTIDKTLRKWFQGIAEWPQDVKDFVDLVWLDAFPDTTRELLAWEKQFGLSSKYLQDGNMESPGVAAWFADNNALLSKVGDSHSGTSALRIEYDTGPGAPNARQTILLVGTDYNITGWARSDGVVLPRVFVQPVGTEIVTPQTIWIGTLSTSWQYFDVDFTAEDKDICLYSQGLAGYVEFDDVTLDSDARREKIARAWVPSTGQSPKRIQDELQANGFDVYVFDAFYWDNELTDGNMEAAGTTAWTAVSATLSKQTTNPYEGTQVIRVAETDQVSYYMRQTGLMTAGHKYWIKGVVRSDGTGTPNVITNGGTVIYTGTTSTSWQHFLFQLNNDDTAGDLTVAFGGTGTDTYVEYDALEIFDLNLTLYRDPTDVIGLSVSGNPLVNKVLRTEKIYTVEAGDDTVYSGERQEAGETHMEAGNYSGFRSLFDPYPIPTDSDKFPHFIYIGGEGFTGLDIDETRREELEDLCLKLCPTEKWIGFIEETVEVWVYLEITTGSPTTAKREALLVHLQETYGKGDTITNADNITWMEAQYPSDDYGQWAVDTSAPVEPPSPAPGPDTLAMGSSQTPVFALARVQLISAG